MPEMPELFVVCCSALHIAVGPFDIRSALKVARMMTDTEEGDCVYLPVPLEGRFQVVRQEKEVENVRHPGQYL